MRQGGSFSKSLSVSGSFLLLGYSFPLVPIGNLGYLMFNWCLSSLASPDLQFLSTENLKIAKISFLLFNRFLASFPEQLNNQANILRGEITEGWTYFSMLCLLPGLWHFLFYLPWQFQITDFCSPTSCYKLGCFLYLLSRDLFLVFQPLTHCKCSEEISNSQKVSLLFCSSLPSGLFALQVLVVSVFLQCL